MLIDTHAHLEAHQFRDDLPDVIQRALDAGVTRIVAIGCDLVTSRECLDLAERWQAVRAAVGVHPGSVTDVREPDWREQLLALAAHPRCVAIGETGLDYYHPPPEGWTHAAYRERQHAFFSAQLELAAETGRNVIVHQRDRRGTDCWRDIRSIVTPWNGRLRAVFHCWVLPWDEAQPMVEQGHLISFTGIATYPHAPDVAACAARASEGSFMLESDSPYLSPVPHRGKRNEPAFVRHTAEKIGALRGTCLTELAAMTSRTADAFFGWCEDSACA